MEFLLCCTILHLLLCCHCSGLAFQGFQVFFLLLLRSCQCFLLVLKTIEVGTQALLAGCLTMFALGRPLLGTLLLVEAMLAGNFMEFLLCRSLLSLVSVQQLLHGFFPM